MAKLKLNMNPELDSPPFEVPKVDLYLEMEKLAVGITRAQYQVLFKTFLHSIRNGSRQNIYFNNHKSIISAAY